MKLIKICRPVDSIVSMSILGVNFWVLVFYFSCMKCHHWGELDEGGSVVNNLPANAGDTGDKGLIPVSGRSPGGRNGYPLQSACLENPMDRGAWQALESMGSHRVHD